MCVQPSPALKSYLPQGLTFPASPVNAPLQDWASGEMLSLLPARATAGQIILRDAIPYATQDRHFGPQSDPDAHSSWREKCDFTKAGDVGHFGNVKRFSFYSASCCL